MSAKYQPITDNAEFAKQCQNLGNIQSEFQRLIDDYKELDNRFIHLDEGEMDAWMVKKSQLNSIYRFIHSEFLKIEDPSIVMKIEARVATDKLITELYDKIYDRRELRIENDSKLQDLYQQVKQVKTLVGRN
jgi:uncharacterized protein YdcH (DUF465 family)